MRIRASKSFCQSQMKGLCFACKTLVYSYNAGIVLILGGVYLHCNENEAGFLTWGTSTALAEHARMMRTYMAMPFDPIGSVL